MFEVVKILFLIVVCIPICSFTSEKQQFTFNPSKVNSLDDIDSSLAGSKPLTRFELDGIMGAFRAMFFDRLRDYDEQLKKLSKENNELKAQVLKNEESTGVRAKTIEARISHLEDILRVDDYYNTILVLTGRIADLEKSRDCLQKKQGKLLEKYDELSAVIRLQQTNFFNLKLELDKLLAQSAQKLKNLEGLSELNDLTDDAPPAIATTPRPDQLEAPRRLHQDPLQLDEPFGCSSSLFSMEITEEESNILSQEEFYKHWEIFLKIEEHKKQFDASISWVPYYNSTPPPAVTLSNSEQHHSDLPSSLSGLSSSFQKKHVRLFNSKMKFKKKKSLWK